MTNKYEVTFGYVYEDCETVEVVADNEEDALSLAEDERDGPDMAWNVPMFTAETSSVVWSGFADEDVDA